MAKERCYDEDRGHKNIALKTKNSPETISKVPQAVMSWFPFLIMGSHAAFLFYFSLHVTDGQSKPMFGPWSDENQLLLGLNAS